MRYLLYISIPIILFINYARAGEKELVDLSMLHYNKGEYYNSITESMRYQYNYPQGKYYAEAILIMGNAYFKGDNYYKASAAYTECYSKYANTPEGEEALLRLGYIRIIKGSPYFAYRSLQEYRYIYDNGRYIEDAEAALCYAGALMDDLPGAKENIQAYRDKYPEGKYTEELNNLNKLIDSEINKTKKSVWVSVAGSVFLPGFGHFYTGKYKIGLLSFFSNAALISLFCHSYKNNNKFGMLIFGIGELSFYQYSLYSAISNVYEYNSDKNFRKSIKLSILQRF